MSAMPRFDLHALRQLAGERVFARGEAYFRDGLVGGLDLGPEGVVARVAGTETYDTVVSGRGTAIGGHCSCPAYARDGFCKHMVAVALAANGESSSRAAGGDDPSAAIREHLKAKGTDALVAIIMEMADRDPALLRKLEVGAAAAGTDDKALEAQLRAAIRDATRTRSYIDYRHARDWAAGVDAALDMLSELASGPRAAMVVGLADYAVDRIETAAESIDDSDGHSGMLMHRVHEIHLAACRAARPDPVALAGKLFRRETGDHDGTFDAAAEEYADILGEAGLAEYRRLAQTAWDNLPGRVGPRHGAEDLGYGRHRLAAILDFFAARDGDVEARIALRAKHLTSQWDYLQLAAFCAEQGREEEALRRAEEGLWLFEDDRPDERLVYFAVDLLVKAKRKTEAEAHLWQAFEKAPNLDLYGRLRKSGGEAAAQRAIGFLQQRLASVAATRWYAPADLLVRIMTKEKMFADAWRLVQEHPVSRDVQEALARASETTHAREARAVYAQRVEDLARGGGNPAYTEAAAFIARIARLQSAAEQAAYVAGVKERHGRKRNFMKLLG